MLDRTPTTTLLERIEAHIDRLDQTLKDSEDLLLSLKRRDREEWIRRLHERLTGTAPNPEPRTEAHAEQPRNPFYRS